MPKYFLRWYYFTRIGIPNSQEVQTPELKVRGVSGMKLYLIQHGEATAEEVDPSRPLTAKGRSDVQKVASFLEGAGVRPNLILHSSKTRARQTAEIIAAQLSPNCQVKEREGLAPNDPVLALTKEISGMDDDRIIVGHLPFLGKLASTLLTGSESRNLVAFRQGGMVCLQRNEDQSWQVAWMVTPDLLMGTDETTEPTEILCALRKTFAINVHILNEDSIIEHT